MSEVLVMLKNLWSTDTYVDTSLVSSVSFPHLIIQLYTRNSVKLMAPVKHF